MGNGIGSPTKSLHFIYVILQVIFNVQDSLNKGTIIYSLANRMSKNGNANLKL